MDSLVSLYVGNLNVELAQCRQLIVWLRSIVKSLIQMLPFPSLDVGKVLFILICVDGGVRIRFVCVHSDRALVSWVPKVPLRCVCKCAALSSYLGCVF